MRYKRPPKNGTTAQSVTQSHFGKSLTSGLLALAANTVVKTPQITINAMVATAALVITPP
jgi:hypothetical protein